MTCQHLWAGDLSLSQLSLSSQLDEHLTSWLLPGMVWRASSSCQLHRVNSPLVKLRSVKTGVFQSKASSFCESFLAHSKNELMQWRGVRCLSVGPSVRLSVNLCANRFFSQTNGRIATKLAHDGLQVSLHPGCAQGQGQGQRSRDTHTFLDSWNELLRHWRSGFRNSLAVTWRQVYLFVFVVNNRS